MTKTEKIKFVKPTRGRWRRWVINYTGKNILKKGTFINQFYWYLKHVNKNINVTFCK